MTSSTRINFTFHLQSIKICISNTMLLSEAIYSSHSSINILTGKEVILFNFIVVILHRTSFHVTFSHEFAAQNAAHTQENLVFGRTTVFLKEKNTEIWFNQPYALSDKKKMGLLLSRNESIIFHYLQSRNYRLKRNCLHKETESQSWLKIKCSFLFYMSKLQPRFSSPPSSHVTN